MAEKQKRNSILGFLKTYNADIVCLQETHNDSEKDEDRWTKEWGGSCLWSRGTNRSRGVAILVKPGLDCNISNIRKDRAGRVICAMIVLNGKEINVMNIYAPTFPRERKRFFEGLWNFKPGNINLVLAGDFNCIEDPDKDKQGGNPNSCTIGMTELAFFLDNNNLWDTHLQDRIYTWNNADFTIRTRLDRWYITTSLEVVATIRACAFSDHSVMEIEFQPQGTEKKGKGLWKMKCESDRKANQGTG